ncbi:hypothetical protein GCM10028796_36860 [Ramlibacter monticola]|uniref:Cell envelope biogenesis protein TolA n=1 Tax=Ramlibacter monticola TaxID=1926872 RepID=A0A936Z471_9BURK|nr:hypothetical protein [Ramlibacter monticola]MBL0394573.1 hypothetical protein [Ramlibacter monticola]
MFKSSLCIAAFIAALVAPPAVFAQSDTPGEGRAAPSKPATKEEKKAARAKRQAHGKEIAKKDEGRLEDPVHKGHSSKKPATAEEKAAAKAARQAEGKEVSKQGSGRLEDKPTSR